MPEIVRDTYKDVDHYTIARAKGMDMSMIRSELDRKGYSEDDIKVIVRMIDRAQARAAELEAERSRSNYLMLAGCLLLVLGSMITFITYLKAAENGGGLYVVWYGAILMGAGMMVRGWFMRN
jgi:hypothetical protein